MMHLIEHKWWWFIKPSFLKPSHSLLSYSFTTLPVALISFSSLGLSLFWLSTWALSHSVTFVIQLFGCSCASVQRCMDLGLLLAGAFYKPWNIKLCKDFNFFSIFKFRVSFEYSEDGNFAFNSLFSGFNGLWLLFSL